jgi:phage terminase small subunit
MPKKVTADTPITPQERVLLTHYAMTGDLTASMRKAGYSMKFPTDNARRILRKPNVKRAYQEIIARPLDEMQANLLRVVREVAHVGFSDIGDVFDDEGNVLPAHEMPEHARRAVSAMKVTRKYFRHKDGSSDLEVTREVKLWPKVTALEMFLKYHEKIQQVVDDEIGIASREKKEFSMERLLAESAKIGLLKSGKEGGNGSNHGKPAVAGTSGETAGEPGT